MTISPEDPLKYHGGHAEDLFREERERGHTMTEDETLFAPGGYDDRQWDAGRSAHDAQEEQEEQEEAAGQPSDQPADASSERT